MSYKVGVKTKDDADWVFNALRFQRRRDAEEYASDLFRRWTAVRQVLVEETTDTPNATYPVPSETYSSSNRGPPGKEVKDSDKE